MPINDRSLEMDSRRSFIFKIVATVSGLIFAESGRPRYANAQAIRHESVNLSLIDTMLGGRSLKAVRANLDGTIQVDLQFSSSSKAVTEGISRLGKDTRAALVEFSEVLVKRPNDAEAITYRGIARYTLRDLSGALEDFDELLSKDAEDPEIYFNRGLVRYHLHDFNGALTDYIDATQLNPSTEVAFACRYNEAAARARLADFQGAIDGYTQLLNLRPKATSVYINRAKLFALVLEYQKAIKDYDWILKYGVPTPTNFRFVEVYLEKGLALLASGSVLKSSGDFKTAVNIATSGLSRYPSSTYLYGIRSTAYAALGKKANAEADLQKVAQIYRTSGDMDRYAKVLDRLSALK